MLLAAQAATPASHRRQTPYTPVSMQSPSQSVHDYTSESFGYGDVLSREHSTPDVSNSRRAELDGTQSLDTGKATGTPSCTTLC